MKASNPLSLDEWNGKDFSSHFDKKTIKICKGTIIFIQEETEPNLVIDKADIFRQRTWFMVFQQQLVMWWMVLKSISFFFAWNFYVGYFSKGN